MLNIAETRTFADSIPAAVGHLWTGERARKTIHDLLDELQAEREFRQRVEQQRAARLKGDCGFVG